MLHRSWLRISISACLFLTAVQCASRDREKIALTSDLRFQSTPAIKLKVADPSFENQDDLDALYAGQATVGNGTFDGPWTVSTLGPVGDASTALYTNAYAQTTGDYFPTTIGNGDNFVVLGKYTQAGHAPGDSPSCTLSQSNLTLVANRKYRLTFRQCGYANTAWQTALPSVTVSIFDANPSTWSYSYVSTLQPTVPGNLTQAFPWRTVTVSNIKIGQNVKGTCEIQLKSASNSAAIIDNVQLQRQ